MNNETDLSEIGDETNGTGSLPACVLGSWHEVVGVLEELGLGSARLLPKTEGSAHTRNFHGQCC